MAAAVQPTDRRRAALARWAAHAAAGVGFAFAAPNLYWALGGTRGLATLGGEIERRAREGDAVILALNGAGLGLKIVGGLLALALVRPWGHRLPTRAVRATAWFAAGILVLYGTAQTVGALLIHLDVVRPDLHPGDSVVRWRLFLWEPWFLVWGLLLGAATWLSAPPRRSVRPGR